MKEKEVIKKEIGCTRCDRGLMCDYCDVGIIKWTPNEKEKRKMKAQQALLEIHPIYMRIMKEEKMKSKEEDK